MPKKGDFLPYRVIYEYSNGVKGREPYRDYYEAEGVAGGIGGRGGIATIIRVEKPRDAQGEILAMFGPDQRHGFRIIPDPHPKGQGNVFRCLCNFIARTDVAADAHIMHAGLCYVCWGNYSVNELTTDPVGNLVLGLPVECPVCDGEGLAYAMDFEGVDMSLYVNRLQALGRI